VVARRRRRLRVAAGVERAFGRLADAGFTDRLL
jgi:hypothetical protein